MINWTYLLIIVFCSLGSCQPKTQSQTRDSSEKHLDWDAISDNLMDRMLLQSEDTVLFVAMPGRFDALINILAKKVAESDAEFLGTLSVNSNQPDQWSTDFTRACAGKSDQEMAELFSSVNLGIMLPGAVPSHTAYRILQEMLESGNRRTIHFHWTGAYDLNGNALEMDATKDQFYQKAILETDYSGLANHQLQLEEAMRGGSIRVTTPAGTDLQFMIGNRPVTKQDGNAAGSRAIIARNLIDREIEVPSGAVRVAPMEESVNGVIAFPDALWNNQKVEGLKMHFTNGKLSHFTADVGMEHVQSEINAAGDAGSSFREFALGLNPLLAIQHGAEPWIPYYGYGAGVVRLSLGDNTELGGNVTGGYVRWNFFVDATVTIASEVWVRDGELLK